MQRLLELIAPKLAKANRNQQECVADVIFAKGGETKMNPEKKFRAGAVSATVWINTNEKGSFPSIQLGKSYKDKDNNWKETSSFGVNDVPKALVVLQEAYKYVAMKEKAAEA